MRAAKDYYEASLDIYKKWVAADPNDSVAQRDLSVCFERLGDVSLRLGQVPAAKDYHQDALHIRKKRAAADPKDSQAQRDLFVSLDNLGDVSLQLGQVQAAKDYYQDSLDILRKRAAADPKNIEAQAELGAGHFKLGRSLSALPDHRQARAAFADALAVLQPLQKAGLLKGTVAGVPQLASARMVGCRWVEEALADMNTAFKYPPETTRWLLLERAKELGRMRKLDDAAATAERLAGLKDTLGEALFFAACARGYIAGVQGADADLQVEHAMKLLLLARGRGYFDLPANRKLLETDRDLELLRTCADFARLQAEIAADTGKLVLDKKAELHSTDPPDRALKKSPCQVHEIKLTAGKRYAIALDRVGAGKFDPLLRLEDASGKELARDDDSGGDLNSLLVFIPAETGMYRIIVTSFDGTAGPYLLTVRERE